MASRYILLLIYALWVTTAPAPARRAAAATQPGAPAPDPGAVASAPSPDELSLYLERAAGGPSADGIAELRRAVALSRTGETAAAIRAFERAAALLPGLADWAHALAADAAAGAGDPAEVRRLLAASEPGLAREWGWQAEVRARRAAGDVRGALQSAIDAAGTLGEPSRRAAAARMAADLGLVLRDTALAITWYRQAIELAPLAMPAVDAARALALIPAITAADHGRIGRLYLRHGNVTRGKAGVDRFVRAGAGTPEERALARLELGRALFNAGSYTEAERRMLALSTERAFPAIAAEALLLAGRSQYRLGRVTAAKATLASAEQRFPGERATAGALFILGDLEHDARRLTGARDFYRRTIEAHPASDEAAEAAMRLAGLAYTRGDRRAAALLLEECRARHPAGSRHQQATYWSGRLHTELGDTTVGHARLREARRLDLASYYGLRAGELLGERLQDALSPAPATDEQAIREAAGAFHRIDVLTELGLERASAFELERVRSHFRTRAGGLYALAEGMHERDDVLGAVRMGREIRSLEGAWNERLLRIVYPFPYRAPILREAKRQGVDPFLAAGLVRQESLFNPGAVSSAGAVGLMQVLPRTGRTLGRAEGIRTVNKTTLRKPDVNIRLGMRYLSDMLSRYDGHVPFMLAAYNAGPSRVAAWRRHAEAADPDLFAERIPFDETREYVKVVQQNARIYRELYGQ